MDLGPSGRPLWNKNKSKSIRGRKKNSSRSANKTMLFSQLADGIFIPNRDAEGDRSLAGKNNTTPH